MIASWVKRAIRDYRQLMGYDSPPAQPPREITLRIQPLISVNASPKLRQPRPVSRRPRIDLPPFPPPFAGPWPWCWCGRTWPDTPRGWASWEAHERAGTEACAKASAAIRRERGRQRQAQKRRATLADPALAAQLRAYEHEIEQRKWERIQADPQLRERERARQREYRRRRQAASAPPPSAC
jgi:hypothetical protein